MITVLPAVHQFFSLLNRKGFEGPKGKGRTGAVCAPVQSTVNTQNTIQDTIYFPNRTVENTKRKKIPIFHYDL